MASDNPNPPPDGETGRASGPRGHEPSRITRFGRRSWLYVGIVVWAAIVYSALAAVAGLVVPLVVAVVIAILVSPLVSAIARVRVPRRLAGVLVLLALAGVSTVSVWLAVNGIIDQGPEIGRELEAGLDHVGAWLDDIGISLDEGSDLIDEGSDLGSWLARGLAGSLSTIFSSAVAFVIGVFVGGFFLYYLLAEWDQLVEWVAGHLAVPADLGASILRDVISAVRQYFTGLTIASLIVAVTIGVTMALLGLPLAFTIGLVTFATAYVPYLGAIFSGTFAFLVALGSGGPTKAFIVLGVVLVAQNVIQTLAQNKLTSTQLRIHPLVNFGSTIVGASLAGILGATLSAPIVASLVRMTGLIRDYETVSVPPAGST